MANTLRLEKTLVILIVLTAIAILGRDRLLQESFVVDASSGYELRLYDDSPAGGNSVTEILQTENEFHWLCDIRAAYQYPHCGFEIRLTDNYARGVDMSHIRKVRLWLDYTGPTNTVRVYLRNFDHRYSRVEDDTTTKYNQVEFKANDPNNYYEFAIDDFFVANWWLIERNIAPNMSHPQFDNIASIDIQTGSGHNLGEHHFVLSRIELIGQRFTNEDWYFGIIVCWAIIVLIFLGYRVVLLSGEVRSRKSRENELLQINTLLDARGKHLEELAKTDALTGAFNRKGIEQAIREGLWEWRRDDKPLSIVMMDVDFFKAVNVTHGHAAGDAILAGISALVKSHIRATDLFARWGGEEFVLVCRNTRINYATHTAEKLRRLIAEHTFEDGLKVTASFGVATLHQNSGLDQLFAAADEALYRAKNKGRNRVEVA
ncbi:MAG TPA: GGDEF domain-containing protein [Cellvibrionaceae bacterium]